MPSFPRGDELTGILSQRSALTLQDQVARLFEQARDDVYRYLLTLGLHPPQAQEAAQEVFLRLYMELRKGTDVQNPRAWIFRVAHNLGLKVRAQQESQPAFDPDLEGQIPSTRMDPEQDLLERERLMRFHRAINGLSDQQRRCLHLRLEGLRYPEIAAVLGISTSAVGEFLRRAVTRLRKAGDA
jgi:RNA polymerase sigma-70 factor, ECF subfamily